jgi:hypothetical protein
MSTYPAAWSLCGGWAVDSWLGRLTRDHGDIDIAIFQDDLGAFFEHLADWQLVAHDSTVAGDTSEPWNGRRLDLPAHIHARSPEDSEPLPERVDNAAGQGFGLDIQICERSGGEWILSRKPRIAMQLARCIEQSDWGLPTLTPEVILFYKSIDPRRRDKLDFLALRPHLKDEQRDWLRNAISLIGHPWLTQLS